MAYIPGDSTHPSVIVTDAWQRARQMSDKYELEIKKNFDDAMRQGGASARMNPATLGFNASVQAPLVDIPFLAEGASTEMFNQWWDAMMDKLATLYAGYIDRYFPNECQYLEHAQRWICDAITQGGTGIKPGVEAQIWERDRARLLREGARAEQDLVRQFAARGFPIPPGALHAGIARVQEDVRDKTAQLSRDVAIKQAEMEVENVRFAVQQAIGLYGVAMDAARNYMAALAGTAGTPAQLLPSVTDSQSRLISAASDYYRSRITAKELELKAAMPNAEYQQQANVKNQDAQMQTIRNQVDVAIEAAKALSTQVSALLNALHTSASISGSSSYGVGFSYSGEVSRDVEPQT
ncbi:Uncharacterised protein [uncultured Comamonas sp.]|nr:Uncharacterised protein [uncultured Comamonas sp.]